MTSFNDLIDYIQTELKSERPSESPRAPMPPWLEAGLSPDANLILDLADDDVLDIPEPLVVPDLPSLGDARFGFDVLAYYLPFHFYGRVWGIYIRAAGIVALANILANNRVFGRGAPAAIIARRALFEHEFFHCIVETAVSRLEVLPTFISISATGIGTKSPISYADYFTRKAAAEHEEALANAQLWIRGLRGATARMKSSCARFMNAQGPGYRDFGRFSTQRTFTQGSRQVIAGLPSSPRIGSAKSTRGTKCAAPTEFLFENVPRASVPTRLVNDTNPPLGRELLVKRHNGICVRVDGNLNHGRPHVHIDHGKSRHTASYAIDDGARLAGYLKKRLDRSVRQWIVKYRQQLLEVWDGIRDTGSISTIIAELKRSDFE
jgi:hypothetical protein